jgi:hypothetical protein
VKRALLVAVVGLVGLAVGVAVAGRPETVPSDVRSADIQIPSTTSTSIARSVTTHPAVTTSSTTATTTSTTAPAATSPATTTTSPIPTQPGTTLVPTAFVRVVVANATNIEGHAGRSAARLRQLGYSNVTAVDAAADRLDTVVFYVPGRRGEAMRMAQQLGYAPQRVRLRPDVSLTLAGEDGENSELWLIVGTDSL